MRQPAPDPRRGRVAPHFYSPNCTALRHGGGDAFARDDLAEVLAEFGLGRVERADDVEAGEECAARNRAASAARQGMNKRSRYCERQQRNLSRSRLLRPRLPRRLRLLAMTKAQFMFRPKSARGGYLPLAPGFPPCDLRSLNWTFKLTLCHGSSVTDERARATVVRSVVTDRQLVRN